MAVRTGLATVCVAALFAGSAHAQVRVQQAQTAQPDFAGALASGEFSGDGKDDIIIGAGPGGGPHVRVINGSSGAEVKSFFAYPPTFTGGVRVAVGDVNNDGVDDIITGPGPGGGPHIKIFDGSTGEVQRSFMAFSPNFSGGVYVAAGDVNNDGFADIIVGSGAGGGPHVKVFSGADGSEVHSFFAYNTNFQGGVYVAAGDINNDGTDDIITGAGPGGGPHVKVFDGRSGAEQQAFFAFTPSFQGGVRVASGDINNDGTDDIIVGAGPGGGGSAQVYVGGANGGVWKTTNGGATYSGGVTVAAGDITGDGVDDIITGAATLAGPHVRVINGSTFEEVELKITAKPERAKPLRRLQNRDN